MSAYDALKETMGLLAASTSMSDIADTLHRVADRFGLTLTLVLVAIDQDKASITDCLSTSQRIMDGRAAPWPDHVVILRARTSMRPFLLTELGEALSGQYQPWRLSSPTSCDGFVVPVHDEDRPAWCAIFTATQGESTYLAQSVLTAATHAAFERSRRVMRTNAPRVRLTAREAECLHLIAAGKTDFEVGIILSISARTVRFHVDNAKKKLGVATRIQAVTTQAVAWSSALAGADRRTTTPAFLKQCSP